VGILAGSDRTKAITSILEDLGGQAQVHDVSDESLAEAETVADEQPVGTTESWPSIPPGVDAAPR